MNDHGLHNGESRGSGTELLTALLGGLLEAGGLHDLASQAIKFLKSKHIIRTALGPQFRVGHLLSGTTISRSLPLKL